MPATARRLSALDASFLEIESTRAHMHVGWVATFQPPERRERPSFEDLRDHVARRLCRAPRYRQRLAPVPLGLRAPEWVDAEDFRIEDHVVSSPTDDVGELADMAFSLPLDRERPLWELWIADRLHDGRIGVVGKAHHCLVDGVAAVELAGLLLDPAPDPDEPEPDGWRPRREPGSVALMAHAVRDFVTDQAPLVRAPAKAMMRPKRLFSFADDARRAAGALAGSLDPAPPARLLNQEISPLRRLALLSRPLDDLLE